MLLNLYNRFFLKKLHKNTVFSKKVKPIFSILAKKIKYDNN